MARSRADSLSPTRRETLPFVHDVIIVGAGPCGLAVAARLREQTPSALFTDEEHHRYHWINKHAAQASIKNSKTGNVRSFDSRRAGSFNPSMLVLDSSGDTWMSKWKQLFSMLEISHLRSPMFFHPDPHDRDGLLAYAHEVGRECECLEIAGCVGKEISKHRMKKKRNNRKAARPSITIDERDRKDYFIPPSDLFQKYCLDIAKRYNLCDDGLIHKATISNIDYDYVPQLSADDKLFTVKTDSSTYYARAVVLAVGADLALTERVRARKSTNVLVIGGGLTSAQIADKAIRRGATKVYHLMRGPMKVKPFDVDLSWMGKFRNHEKASFWSADSDEERAELVKSARGGGSITPRFAKISEQHVRCGKLALHTYTTVRSTAFDPLEQIWSIETDPPIHDLPKIHHVYWATGVQSDCQRLDHMRTIVEKYPIETYDGLPALTDDLMWKPEVPLFMTGKFAALRLGPGAGNLEGARLGAERVVWGLQDVLGEDCVTPDCAEDAEPADGHGGRQRYAAGIGSRFEALDLEP